MARGCREGKRPAQTAFYDRFAPRLYVTAFRLLNHSAEAEEVVQEVLLRTLTNTKTLLDGVQDMERRLNRMTINASIDHLRKQRKVTRELWDEKMDTEEDASMEKLLMLEEERGMLRLAIEALPVQSRTVLQLAILEEMETEEIATLLHIKASSVRAHLSRAKQKLINWFRHEN